jgi:hypothetical protein
MQHPNSQKPRPQLFLVWLVLFFGLLVNISAQDVVSLDPLKPVTIDISAEIPQKPYDYIVDDARVLTPTSREALTAKLMEMGKRHKVHIYVVTAIYITGMNARQRAEMLAQAWLQRPAQFGGVIVFDQGAKAEDAFGVAGSEDGSGALTRLDLLQILKNSLHATNSTKGSTSDKLVAGAESMLLRFRELKPNLDAIRWNSPRQWTLISLVVGAMALCLGLLAIIKRLEKARDEKNRERYLFPEIDVGIRYGAPHGGGIMSTLEFSQTK